MTAVATTAPLDQATYERVIAQAVELVEETVPPEAVVAVLSRGDARLVELNGREGWHFPQSEDGLYAGHHPADSADAITHVERVRAKGAGFLLIPSTAFWWFDHYRDFKRHLDRRYRVLVHDAETCALYSLSDRPDDASDPAELGPLRRRELTSQIQDVVASTLPDDATVLVWAFAQPRLLELDGKRTEPFAQGVDADLPDEETLIADLEARRSDGAQFLLVSVTTLSQLDQRPRLKRHLEDRHRLAVEQRHLCRIYELRERVGAFEAPTRPSPIPGRFRRA